MQGLQGQIHPQDQADPPRHRNSDDRWPWLTDYWDESLPGFGVRIHHSGRKAYFIRYTVEGKRRRMNLGTYPALSLADARDKAKEVIGRIAAGADPQAKRQADVTDRGESHDVHGNSPAGGVEDLEPCGERDYGSL